MSLGYCLLRSIKGWHTLHPRFELLIQSPGNQGRTASDIKRKEILLLPPDNAGHPEGGLSEPPLGQVLHNRGTR